MKFFLISIIQVCVVVCLFCLWARVDKISEFSSDIEEVRTTVVEQAQKRRLPADTMKNINEWSLRSCDTAVITSKGVTRMLVNCYYDKQTAFVR